MDSKNQIQKREIKFRAWDKSRKLMGIVTLIDWFHEHMIKAVIVDYDDDRLDNPFNIELLLDNIELMQFTGLKDKNGKEIYESDILKFSEIMSDKALAVKYSCGMFVVYDPNCCSVCKDGPGYTCSLDEAIMYPLADEEGNHAEVIGNIYENPELLSK